jgi:hypothetical protein
MVTSIQMEKWFKHEAELLYAKLDETGPDHADGWLLARFAVPWPGAPPIAAVTM